MKESWTIWQFISCRYSSRRFRIASSGTCEMVMSIGSLESVTVGGPGSGLEHRDAGLTLESQDRSKVGDTNMTITYLDVPFDHLEAMQVARSLLSFLRSLRGTHRGRFRERIALTSWSPTSRARPTAAGGHRLGLRRRPGARHAARPDGGERIPGQRTGQLVPRRRRIDRNAHLAAVSRSSGHTSIS